MHQRIARTSSYLARLIINQHTARTNAAEGSATLRERRLDREQVDEYLRGRVLTSKRPRGPHSAGSQVSTDYQTSATS